MAPAKGEKNDVALTMAAMRDRVDLGRAIVKPEDLATIDYLVGAAAEHADPTGDEETAVGVALGVVGTTFKVAQQIERKMSLLANLEPGPQYNYTRMRNEKMGN